MNAFVVIGRSIRLDQPSAAVIFQEGPRRTPAPIFDPANLPSVNRTREVHRMGGLKTNSVPVIHGSAELMTHRFVSANLDQLLERDIVVKTRQTQIEFVS